jgi:hypothetical protein
VVALSVVVERPLVAVRGDHERDVQALRGSLVGLRLVEAVRRGLVLTLRLQDGDRHGLGVRRDLDLECVVRATVGLASGLAVDDLDRAGVSSRRIRSSVQPRAYSEGSISCVRVSASLRAMRTNVKQTARAWSSGIDALMEVPSHLDAPQTSQDC